jgi:hypothetical protein
VRLWVDAPLDEGTAYPRYLYNRQEHERSMYFHNMVTRMQHLDASNRIRVSYDQHAAHGVFNSWKNRAMEDVTLSGIEDEQQRYEWIAARIKELDNAFDRALGLRVSHELKPYLFVGSSMGGDDVMQMAIAKTDTRRMWNRNGNRKRNRKLQMQQQQQQQQGVSTLSSSSSARKRTTTTTTTSDSASSSRYYAALAASNEHEEDDEVEDGEIPDDL